LLFFYLNFRIIVFMNIKALNDYEIKENIVKIIKKYLLESKILLFGSRARGTNSEHSEKNYMIR